MFIVPTFARFSGSGSSFSSTSPNAQRSLKSEPSGFLSLPYTVGRRRSLTEVLEWTDSQRVWLMMILSVSAPAVVAW